MCLTKLDFWLDANPEVGKGTVLAKNGNEEHRGSISDVRLDSISRQVNHRLKNVKGDGLMEVMMKNLGMKDAGIHTAYTAVASRMVPGNEQVFEKIGIDYDTSLNVIEPLLNIFSWGDLLPHDSNERQIEKGPEEQETPIAEPAHSPWWKKLFHRGN